MNKIVLRDWHYSCGEPMCCDDYGNDLIVNDENLGNIDGMTYMEMIEALLNKLGVEYEIEHTY